MKRISLEEASACPYCQAQLPYQALSGLDLPAGHVLQNRYIIGRLLGRGGFGATYIAFDQFTQERCAIKEYFPHQMVTRDQGNPMVEQLKPQEFAHYQKRFFDEAKQLKDLSHVEGMVRLYDVFTDNGTAYFVMEYVSGTNLKKHLAKQKGGITQREGINILCQLLKILSSVHSSGVLHRDISPDNICLMEDGRIKLIDFGSARSTVASNMTVYRKGMYTAPEQSAGQTQGNYTDLYAVGVVMFEMFMGRMPVAQEINLEPMTNDARSPLYNLNRVYMKATRTNPKERYQFAQDMLSDMQAIQMVDDKALQKARKQKAKSGTGIFSKRQKKSSLVINTDPKKSKPPKSEAKKKAEPKPKKERPAKTKRAVSPAMVILLVALCVLFLILISIIVLS